MRCQTGNHDDSHGMRFLANFKPILFLPLTPRLLVFTVSIVIQLLDRRLPQKLEGERWIQDKLKCHKACCFYQRSAVCFFLINDPHIFENFSLISRVLKKFILILFAIILIAFIDECIYGDLYSAIQKCFLLEFFKLLIYSF